MAVAEVKLEEDHALDHLRDPARALASGNGYVLHDGRIHSRPTRDCDRRRRHPSHSGPQGRVTGAGRRSPRSPQPSILTVTRRVLSSPVCSVRRTRDPTATPESISRAVSFESRVTEWVFFSPVMTSIFLPGS